MKLMLVRRMRLVDERPLSPLDGDACACFLLTQPIDKAFIRTKGRQPSLGRSCEVHSSGSSVQSCIAPFFVKGIPTHRRAANGRKPTIQVTPSVSLARPLVICVQYYFLLSSWTPRATLVSSRGILPDKRHILLLIFYHGLRVYPEQRSLLPSRRRQGP